MNVMYHCVLVKSAEFWASFCAEQARRHFAMLNERNEKTTGNKFHREKSRLIHRFFHGLSWTFIGKLVSQFAANVFLKTLPLAHWYEKHEKIPWRYFLIVKNM